MCIRDRHKVEGITNVARIKLSIEDAHRLADIAIAEIGEATKPTLPIATSTSSSPLTNACLLYTSRCV